MKDGRLQSEPVGDMEAKLARTLAAGARLSVDRRQRIWHAAVDRADEQATADARPPRIPMRRIRMRRGVPMRRLWRWVVYPSLVMLMAVAFLGGYAGTVFAAGSSLPGEPLYRFERRAEAVWLTLTPNSRRCEVQLSLLERRVYETRALLVAGQAVPQDLLQEIILLFIGMGEELEVSTAQCEDSLDRLLLYRETLQFLFLHYPGVWHLDEALRAADAAVVQVGGPPLEWHVPGNFDIELP